MNIDDIIKKQLQGLGLIFAILFFFGESFLLGNMPKDIKANKTKIKTYKEELQAFERLQTSYRSLEMELEENSFSFEKLLEKYPSDEYTQNLINRIITGITASVIVVNDRLLPIRKLDYIAPDSLEVTVPKISSSDKELKVDRTLEISIYESEVEIRCNYFEFLEFLHDTANQDIFLTPMDLEILPEAEVPYGITAKVKLLTFGFDGIKPDKF